MFIKGNMNIEESMKEYVPITQTYFDVTEDYLIFCKSGASLDTREVGEAVGASLDSPMKRLLGLMFIIFH